MDRKQLPHGPLELFVIYDHPADYPGYFVVRRWFGAKPTSDFAVADTIEAARAEVPAGLHCLARQPGDDPVIVETWI